jgi:hypothetical protein
MFVIYELQANLGDQNIECKENNHLLIKACAARAYNNLISKQHYLICGQ